MVRGKSIIVSLALLLVGSYVCAGDIGKLRNDYESFKRNNSQNLSPENLSTLSSKLDSVQGALASKKQQGASTTYSKPIQKWIDGERAWLASVNPMPEAPTKKYDAAYFEKVKAEEEKTKKEQQARFNQFIIGARGAYQNGQLAALTNIYNNAQAVIPTLDRIPEEYKKATLAEIRSLKDDLQKGKEAQIKVLSAAEAQQQLNDIVNNFRDAWFSSDEKVKQAAQKDAWDGIMLLVKQPNITEEQIKKALKDMEELTKAPQIEMGTTGTLTPAGALKPSGTSEPITKHGAQTGYGQINTPAENKKQFAALEASFLTALEGANVSQMKSDYNQMIALFASMGYTADDQEALKIEYQKLIDAATIIERRSDQFFNLLKTSGIVKLEAFYGVTRGFVEDKVKDIKPSAQYMEYVNDAIDALLSNIRKTINARKEEAELKSKSSFPLD